MSNILDNLPIPPRPAQSRVIFQSNSYVASAMRDGSLIVQDVRHGTGRRLIGEQVKDWSSAIEQAMDSMEAAQLCCAFLTH